MSIPCILIPALVGIISGILGYLIGKPFSKGNEFDNQLVNQLRTDLENCKKSSQKLELDYAKKEDELLELQSKSVAVESAKVMSSAAPIVASNKIESNEFNDAFSFDSKAAFVALGKKIKQDDLKIVEGIGPKIADLFQQEGINTWSKLADTSVERAHEILSAAGERFAMHNPGTWPRQAKLLNEGKFEEFKKWTDQLDRGKE